MKTHSNVMYLWVLFCVMLLASCAGVIPETPKQRLASLDAQVTAVITTAADLRAGGLMDDDQYKKVDQVIQTLNSALSIAWTALGTGDMTTVDAQILIVNQALWEVRKQLSEIQTNQDTDIPLKTTGGAP